MAEREADKRLQEIWDNGGRTFSISRLNCVNQCEWQFFLNYVLNIPKSNTGIYGLLGGKVHDKIEEIIKFEATEDELKPTIQEELDDLEMFGIEFPKGRNGEDSIKNNWIANITRFAEEFKRPDGKFITEELLILPIGNDNYMMGYADAIRLYDDGSVDLIDWKTSSQFTGAHLIEAGRQLVCYKLALEHLGYKVNKCCWYMLKYCETTWTLKNGKTKSKVSEWRNLIKDMSGYIEKALSDLGYDEMDIECMMVDGIEKNSWDVFPKEIQNKFHTDVYIRDYEITDEVIEETLEYINKSIERIDQLKSKKDCTHCDISKQSFFCNTLCDFGGKSGKCDHWIEYCATFEKKNDDEDLF